MKNKTLLVSLIIILFSTFSYGQTVIVKLSPAPQGKLGVADLWNVSLTNASNETYEIYLYGTLTEKSEGLIATATTSSFDLKKGTRKIKASDFPATPDVTYPGGNPKYKKALVMTGSLPPGEYEYCVYAKLKKNNQDMGSDCLEQIIPDMEMINLISPADNEELDSKIPVVFTWMSSKPKPAAKYTLKIVEILSGQTPENAMKQNNAFFIKDNITATTFFYPPTAAKFTEGKKYAIRVISGEIFSDIINIKIKQTNEIDSSLCTSSKLCPEIMAQVWKRYSNWNFGNKAGIKFNDLTGIPSAQNSNSMIAHEGCASISDVNGNLLFYTNGINLWDFNDNKITSPGNLLKGGESSTQAVMIIPKPLSNYQKYYVITTPEWGNGFSYYSVVDIGFPNYNITFEANQVNILLNYPQSQYYPENQFPKNNSEKLTAICRINGKDMWIIMHEKIGRRFLFFLADENGITFHHSETQQGYYSTYSSVPGHMKISPDGTKLAVALAQDNHIIIYNLNTNNESSMLSSPNVIYLNEQVYGIEFSPNSQLLYATVGGDPPTSNNFFFQYRISDRVKTMEINLTMSYYRLESLQLGPDSRIYICTNKGSTSAEGGQLDAILCPDVEGIGCNYTQGFVPLSPNTNGTAGLPNIPYYCCGATSDCDCSIEPYLYNMTYNNTTLDISNGISTILTETPNNGMVSFNLPVYTCSGANCNVDYLTTITGPGSPVQYFNSKIFDFQLSPNLGTYTVNVKIICGGKECINSTSTFTEQCGCGNTPYSSFNIKYDNNNYTMICGSTTTIDVATSNPQIYFELPHYFCSYNKNCDAMYRTTITGPTNVPLQDTWNFDLTLSPGTYTIKTEIFCGEIPQLCMTCNSTLVIKACYCPVPKHWYNNFSILYTPPAGPPAVSTTINGNDVLGGSDIKFTNTLYICASNCNTVYEWYIQSPVGLIPSISSPFISNTPVIQYTVPVTSVNTDYILVVRALCGSVKCDSTVFFFRGKPGVTYDSCGQFTSTTNVIWMGGFKESNIFDYFRSCGSNFHLLESRSLGLQLLNTVSPNNFSCYDCYPVHEYKIFTYNITSIPPSLVYLTGESGSQNLTINYIFDGGGKYKVEYKVKCGSKECISCDLYINKPGGTQN